MEPVGPFRKLFGRFLKAAIGLLLVSGSSVVLSGSLDLSPALPDQPEPVLQEPWPRDEAYFDAEGSRSRSLTLVETDGVLSAEWKLMSNAEDPVVKAVSAGKASAVPWEFVSEVVWAEFSPAEGTTDPVPKWFLTAPTVSTDGEKTSLQVRASTKLAGSRIQIRLAGCYECAVDVDIRSDQYLVSGLTPDPWLGSDIDGQPPLSEMSVQNRQPNMAKFRMATGTVMVTLTDAAAGLPPTSRQTLDWGLSAWPWWNVEYVWRTLWFTLPWLILLLTPLPLLQRSVDRRNVGLMLSGLLLALYVTVAAGSVDELLRKAVLFISEITGERFFGFGGTIFAALLGVVWAGAALISVVQSPRTRTAVRGYLILIALAAGAVIFVAFASRSTGTGPLHTGNFMYLAGPALLAGLVGCWLLVHSLSRGYLQVGTRLLIAVTGAAAVGAMVALSSVSTTLAAWAGGIAALVFGSVFVATLLTVPLAHVVRDYLNDTSRQKWAHRLPLVWFMLFALCIWITFPREYSMYSLAPLDATDVYRVASATVGAAKVGLFASLLALLWTLSKDGKDWTHPKGRVFAVFVGAAMLLRPEVLFGNFLPVSFLAGVLLLNSVLIPGKELPADYGDARPPDLTATKKYDVSRIARAGNRHRLLRELEKTLGKKAASGEKPLEEVDKEVIQFREYARRSAEAGVADMDPALRARAFGTGHTGPWRRAIAGAGIATVAGLPGFLQALASLSQLENLEGAVPVLSASTTIILILRYPLYGFFFGYFLPRFRGDTAVVKSLYFFIVLGVSETIVLLLPYRQDQDVLGAFLSWVAQIFLICFALGVTFDYLVLRKAGFGFGALMDVHHTSRLVAFSSAVVASVVTAAASVLATSAIDIIAEKIAGPR